MTGTQAPDEIQSVREGKISRVDDQPLGVCIYVSAKELRSMGIQLNGKETIRYQVEATTIKLMERKPTTR